MIASTLGMIINIFRLCNPECQEGSQKLHCHIIILEDSGQKVGEGWPIFEVEYNQVTSLGAG